MAPDRLWVYEFEEKKSLSLVWPKGLRMLNIKVEIQKKKFLVQPNNHFPIQESGISRQ